MTVPTVSPLSALVIRPGTVPLMLLIFLMTSLACRI